MPHHPTAAAAVAETRPGDRHPVDEVLKPGAMVVYGLQHVMSMYAGVVAVPFIVGTALGLQFTDLAYLLAATLLVSGLATLVQTLGVWRIGARLPIVQGTSFAAVASMLAIGKAAGGGTSGLRGIFGAILVAGLVGALFSPEYQPGGHVPHDPTVHADDGLGRPRTEPSSRAE
jgi:xanthine/uracil permease